jgi:arabinose-5-phosphate isomerase
MSANPKVINSDNLAYDAFIIMKQSNITQLVVLNNKNYVGIVHMHDIIKEGIVK